MIIPFFRYKNIKHPIQSQIITILFLTFLSPKYYLCIWEEKENTSQMEKYYWQSAKKAGDIIGRIKKKSKRKT
jgi:hypothetical protein